MYMYVHVGMHMYAHAMRYWHGREMLCLCTTRDNGFATKRFEPINLNELRFCLIGRKDEEIVKLDFLKAGTDFMKLYRPP
jgi:hypothetical protein